MIHRADFLKTNKLRFLRRLLIFPVIYDFIKVVLSSFVFFILLNFYFIPKILIGLQRLLHLPKFIVDKEANFTDKSCKKLVNFFDKQLDIKKWQLIDLAFKTMFSKKTRTAVTIGGMAIGIGATVFLLSIGYGAEKLVKGRVANLNQIKQADISSNNQKQLPINNQTIKDILKITGVKDILPLVSVVGKVDYKGSAVDVVVYASDEEYLNVSDIKSIKGSFFTTKKSWEKDYQNKNLIDFVLNKKVSQFIDNNLNTEEKEIGQVHSKATDDKISKVLGISSVISTTPAVSPVPSSNADNDKLFNGDINFEDPAIYNVLPEIKPADQAQKEVEINIIEGEALKEAIVTESFLSALGINKDKALNESFNIKFTLVGDLIPEVEGKKVSSGSALYRIRSVIPGDKPFLYISLKDLKTLGVTNYSQLKLIATNESAIPGLRQKIEAMGFETQSVQDTLERIESLFSGLRIALLLLGVLALSVAALGMFNTLTVSLLERTHEVGLLKSLGMKSKEVKEMFLAESLILGFFGGVAGVAFGFIFGKILDLILSAFSIAAGQGPISVTYIPGTLVIFTLTLSYIIGVVTGFYPSRRATKISALDALRYE